jgi:hypothetical protein
MEWQVWSDGALETFRADDSDEAREKAIEWIESGDWEEKCMVNVHWGKIGKDGKVIEATKENEWVECGEDAETPDCVEEEHEWVRPHELVGGCTQNPGVWSLGGTKLKQKSVCENCGMYKVEIWHGNQRNPDEVDEVEYIDSDQESIDFFELD